MLTDKTDVQEIGSGDKGKTSEEGINIVDPTDKCKLCNKVVSNEDNFVMVISSGAMQNVRN